MSTIEYQTASTTNGTAIGWRTLLQKLGPLVGFLFVFGLFAALRPQKFLTVDNFRLILQLTAVVGTAALGMTLIIISGGIDLTPGSNIALCTVVIGLLLNAGLPPVAAAMGGILTAALVGSAIGAMVVGHLGTVVAAVCGLETFLFIHGGLQQSLTVSLPAAGALAILLGLVTWRFLPRVTLPPFIVTLGLWGSIRGLAEDVATTGTSTPGSMGSSTVNPPETWLNDLLNNPRQGHGWAMLPPGVWMMLGLAIFVAVLLRYTKFGRHVYAIGSNEQTARLCGINVSRTKVLVYILAGALVGVAGLLQFSFLTVGDSTTAVGLELNIIAAVVIGGASLSGGEGGVVGTMLGALMMTAVANGCAKMGLPNFRELEVTGVIIIIAAWLDGLRHLRTD